MAGAEVAGWAMAILEAEAAHWAVASSVAATVEPRADCSASARAAAAAHAEAREVAALMVVATLEG